MYDNMGLEGSVSIAICFIPVFIVTTIFLGFNFVAGALVTMTIFMIIINTGAICVLWDVQFNRKYRSFVFFQGNRIKCAAFTSICKFLFSFLALSIINFITGIGISIEFTGHFMSQYLADGGETRELRVKNTVRTILRVFSKRSIFF